MQFDHRPRGLSGLVGLTCLGLTLLAACSGEHRPWLRVQAGPAHIDTRSALVASRGSCPLIRLSRIAASITSLATGPPWSRELAKATIP